MQGGSLVAALRRRQSVHAFRIQQGIEDALKSLACPKCETQLPISGRNSFLITRWDVAFGAYATLVSRGVGVAICSHCAQAVTTDLPQVMVRGYEAVLGLPDGFSVKELATLRTQLGHKRPELQVEIAEGAVAFRRALIRRFLLPAMELLRAYVVSGGNIEWFQNHADRLDDSLFEGLFLLGTGAVHIFVRPATDEPDEMPVFVPGAEAPEDAWHLRRRDAAAREHRVTCGRLIAGWLVHVAYEAARANSLAGLEVLRGTHLRLLLLSDAVLPTVSEQVGRIVQVANEHDELLLSYLTDAALAKACAEAGIENPRRSEWTRAFITFDTARRAGGGDNRWLPSTAALQQTLDAATFLQSFRQQFLRLRASSHEELANVAYGRALAECGYHVFPTEVGFLCRTLLREQVRDAPPLSYEAARTLVEAALAPPLRYLEIQRALAQVCADRNVPVAEIVAWALNVHADSLGPAGCLSVLVCCLELLKDMARWDSVDALIGVGLQVVGDGNVRGDSVFARETAHFYNEIGNALRTRARQGDSALFEEAIAAYERSLELLGPGPSDFTRRVAQRNIAIVQRERHRYAEARKLFCELRELVEPHELVALVTSEAMCLLEMGQTEEALRLIDEYKSHAEGAFVSETGVLEFATLSAFLHARIGELDVALAILQRLLHEAERRKYHATYLIHRDIVLQSGALTGGQRRDALDEQVRLLRHLQGQSLGAIEMQALRTVDEWLTASGREDEAESLLRGHIAETSAARSPRAWYLHVTAARHALRRKAEDQAARDVDAALEHFTAGVTAVVESGDLHNFTAPDMEDAALLVAYALALGTGTPTGAAARRWRQAADVFASPALTSRILKKAGVVALPDPYGAGLEMLLHDSACAAIQFCATPSGVMALRSTTCSAGGLRTTAQRLPVPLDALMEVARKLSFKLQSANPKEPGLPVDALKDWPAAAAAIASVFDGLPNDRCVFVVAGPVPELLVSVAAGERCAVQFVPSLTAAVSLNENPRTSNVARRVFGFATWFDRERPESAAALAAVGPQLQKIAQQQGWAVEHVAGIDATRERLLEGLQRSDIAWIACHGQLLPQQFSVDLLVAAERRLPPADLRQAADHVRAAHLVGWRDLQGLERASPIVLSSACDTGTVLRNKAGERLGLERTLFQAGTTLFVAPLWPVPTVYVQAVVAQLLESVMRDPSTPMAVQLLRVCARSRELGIPALAYRALAVFGINPPLSTSS